MRTLIFAASAREDLRSIAAYIRAAAGVAIARQVVERLRSRCDTLAETPGEIGTLRPELIEGIRSFPVPPHVLYFRYRADRVEIVRILHERQDAERHVV